MINESVTLDDITHWTPAGSCLRLRMLRLDRIHPVVSGNKWFKLAPNLEAAQDAGFSSILSFGGGYSNHLVALAFAANARGFGSVGIVRGHYADPTPALQACMNFGMELRFVSGIEYSRLKDGKDPELNTHFPGHWIVPEGGANADGIQGAARIAHLIPANATEVCVAVGFGTTMAGLDLGLIGRCGLHGYCVAKDMSQAESLVRASCSRERITLHRVADPRFGRWTQGLIRFIRDFHAATDITLDVVYTGKMMQELQRQLMTGSFVGNDIVCVHTGGLQGNPAGLFNGRSAPELVA